jgi:hypothetical protein
MAKHITLLLILVVVPLLQSNSLQVDLPYEPFDFEQIEKDKKQILKSKNRIDFDWNEPSHQYFFWINLADLATTIYAMENRDNLYEGNILLDDKPRPEELLLQKVVISYAFHQLGMFSGQKLTDDWLYLTNVGVTLATINNYRLIKRND